MFTDFVLATTLLMLIPTFGGTEVDIRDHKCRVLQKSFDHYKDQWYKAKVDEKYWTGKFDTMGRHYKYIRHWREHDAVVTKKKMKDMGCLP